VPSSLVEARFPAMCGIDTLTTVVSRISMKVANMTEKVTTQGLIARCGQASSGLIRADYFRRSVRSDYETAGGYYSVMGITERGDGRSRRE